MKTMLRGMRDRNRLGQMRVVDRVERAGYDTQAQDLSVNAWNG
ncbi:hypothetical protein GCM10009677_23030 [Sphaerisporangium rubeum]|uniref:Uncharacterized protein n=1 Tax=Sphaerisporangium rubeum TaxID=321317 RepID=A0A7X0IJK2_9ACTN|nr:hypothetical protein [Sphaerisporangium rubeum]MBB6476381.1 hypothetical protein [Sphaerisporangium rubeum]